MKGLKYVFFILHDHFLDFTYITITMSILIMNPYINMYENIFFKEKMYIK